MQLPSQLFLQTSEFAYAIMVLLNVFAKSFLPSPPPPLGRWDVTDIQQLKSERMSQCC